MTPKLFDYETITYEENAGGLGNTKPPRADELIQ